MSDSKKSITLKDTEETLHLVIPECPWSPTFTSAVKEPVFDSGCIDVSGCIGCEAP